jgi:hypothetical protein
MPPKINAQRAVIAPEFIDLMIELYAEWMTRNNNLIIQGTQREGFKHYAFTARRMLPIVRRQSNDREGLDYEVTRLRGLPFTHFLAVMDVDPTEESGEKIPWLVGRTKHVRIADYRRRSEIIGELGCYDIYIPSTIVRTPQLGHIHMIPQRNQRSHNRHPHHYLNDGRLYDNEMVMDRSPLSYLTGNCWGSYSAVIKRQVDLPDFPALFGQLYGHLSTYGDSPPRHMDQLDFDIHTPER